MSSSPQLRRTVLRTAVVTLASCLVVGLSSLTYDAARGVYSALLVSDNNFTAGQASQVLLLVLG